MSAFANFLASLLKNVLPAKFELQFDEAVEAEQLQKTKEATVSEFLGNIKGIAVVLPQEEAYSKMRDEAFNYNYAGYPVCFVVPKNEDELKKIVKALPRNGPSISVMCGGHSAKCMVTGSICINMKLFTSVTFDEGFTTVTAGGGCKLEAVDKACFEKTNGKKAIITGTNPDTGIGGLNLAGGFGWLSGKHGMACDTVVEYRIMLHSGEVVVANDQNEYKDLTRALRGGGGNFGIVLSFKMELYSAENMYGGFFAAITPTMNMAKTYMKNQVAKAESPEFKNATFALMLPVGAPVSPTVVFFSGGEVPLTNEDRERMDAVPSTAGSLLVMQKNYKAMQYHSEVQWLLVPFIKRGHCNATSVACDMSDAVIDALLHFTRVDYVNKNSIVICFQTSGACLNEKPDRPSCISFRKKWWIVIESVFARGQEEAAKQWSTRLREKLISLSANDCQSYNTTHSFAEVFNGHGKGTAKYEEIKEHLRKAKAKYDPENLFSNNMNISV